MKYKNSDCTENKSNRKNKEIKILEEIKKGGKKFKVRREFYYSI